MTPGTGDLLGPGCQADRGSSAGWQRMMAEAEQVVEEEFDDPGFTQASAQY